MSNPAVRTLKQTNLSAGERAALEQAARLLKARFPVKEVFLFGSRARRQGDAESDLDLLIVTARPMDWRERADVVDALFEIELAHDVVLSPLVVTQEEWRTGGCSLLPFHDEIARDGVAL